MSQSNYYYKGLEAFGDDPGTFYPPMAKDAQPLNLSTLDDNLAKENIKQLSNQLPIIWYVDDERGNREWFRDYHREDFAIVTFSSRHYFSRALAKSIPCDAIVTDIFFPAKPVKDDKQAGELLSIYDEMEECQVSKLPDIWSRQKESWSLDGFSIARDAVYHQPPIPVFLFSRKAAFLLSIDDYLTHPPSIGNSYWLPEKVNPTLSTQSSRKAAQIQRDRIVAILGVRRSRWRKLLDSLSVGSGEGPINMQELVK